MIITGEWAKVIFIFFFILLNKIILQEQIKISD